ADPEEALQEVDEAEALDLLRRELLGDLDGPGLPHLLRVVAEAHPVQGGAEALPSPVLEVLDGDRDHGVEEGGDRELHHDAEAEQGIELEQRLLHLERVLEALPLEVAMDHLAAL